MHLAAPISDEYKKGPTEGRSLYLDAQATTPLVSYARYITPHDAINTRATMPSGCAGPTGIGQDDAVFHSVPR